MKKFFFFALFALTTLTCFCQITYEKGYITEESGQTFSAYIKFDELADGYSEIQYKLSPSGAVKTANIEAVKQFGIGESYKFTRHTVNIDRSPEKVKDLSTDRNAEFQEETVFLRTLLEGEYSLLYYRKDSFRRFFIKKHDGEPEQLIYKKYRTGDNVIRENNRYKQQLFNLLRCENISGKDLENLNYTRSNLVNLFQKYHQCTNSKYEVLKIERKGNFNLTVKAGVNFTNFGMEQDVYDIVENFDYQVDPRIGLEIEYILPLVNNKIAVYMEPSFSMYSAEKEIIIATNESLPSNPNAPTGYRAMVNMDYKILDLPLGFRYYFYLNKTYTSKIFLNAGASLNLIFNSSTLVNKVNSENSDFDFNQSWQPTFFGGIGYRYNEKISVEARYFPVRPLTDNGGYKLHQNHSFAVVMGYTLFYMFLDKGAADTGENS